MNILSYSLKKIKIKLVRKTHLPDELSPQIMQRRGCLGYKNSSELKLLLYLFI